MVRSPRLLGWVLVGAAACGPEQGLPQESTGTTGSTSAAQSDSSTGEPTGGSSSSSTGCTTGEVVECMGVEVTPGGPLGCDGVELALDDECDALAGFEECADRTVHRHTSVPCNTSVDIMACRGPREGCSGDEDCEAGWACACEVRWPSDEPQRMWLLSTFNACVPANCRSDADCGGLRCGVSRDMCGFVDGFYCRTPEDTCASDLDCDDPDNKRRCAYSWESKRWACDYYAYCE